MGPAFGTADADNLRRAAKMQTYEGMVGVLLGFNTRDSDVVDAFATSPAPMGLTAQLLASPTANLVYNMVTPCRIFDTRIAGGKVAHLEALHRFQSQRQFFGAGRYG